MPNNLEAPSLASWLRHLSQIMPPTGAVVVGAGGGTWLKSLSSLRVEYVDCIEADEKQAHYLRPLLEEHPGWHLHQALIWSEERELTYHIASNPAESGVIEPETLATIWPNLTTRSREPRQAVTLRHLLEGIPSERQPNWLIIDCMPAQPILQGLSERLNQFDVIVARCQTDSASSNGMDDTSQSDSHKPAAEKPTTTMTRNTALSCQALENMLAANGYLLLLPTPERQPRIVNTLYIRDWRAMERSTHLALTPQLDELKRQLEEVSQHNLQLRNSNADYETSQQQLTREIEKAHSQLDAHKKDMTLVAKEKTSLATQLEASLKQGTERLLEINELRQQMQHAFADCMASQRKLNQEIGNTQAQSDAYKQNLNQVTQENISLTVQLEASLKQGTERLQEISELRQQIQSLQTIASDSGNRQDLMQEEMARAEAQLELIKEILLNESVK